MCAEDQAATDGEGDKTSILIILSPTRKRTVDIDIALFLNIWLQSNPKQYTIAVSNLHGTTAREKAKADFLDIKKVSNQYDRFTEEKKDLARVDKI